MSSRQNNTPIVARSGLAVLWMATILVGLSAGFFFTYAASVTLGLAPVSDVAYVETFQAINETVSNPAFGLVFFGSIPAMIAAIAINWRSVPMVTRVLMIVALALYLAGLMITGTQNVPLNNELALVEPVTPTSATVARTAFEAEWNRFNLYRTLAIGAGFASLAGAGILTSGRQNTTALAGDWAHT